MSGIFKDADFILFVIFCELLSLLFSYRQIHCGLMQMSLMARDKA